MGSQLKADEWFKLTADQRIGRCLVMAEEVRLLSATAPLEMKKDYIFLASHWLTLAVEIHRSSPRKGTAN